MAIDVLAFKIATLVEMTTLLWIPPPDSFWRLSFWDSFGFVGFSVPPLGQPRARDKNTWQANGVPYSHMVHWAVNIPVVVKSPGSVVSQLLSSSWLPTTRPFLWRVFNALNQHICVQSLAIFLLHLNLFILFLGSCGNQKNRCLRARWNIRNPTSTYAK